MDKKAELFKGSGRVDPGLEEFFGPARRSMLNCATKVAKFNRGDNTDALLPVVFSIFSFAQYLFHVQSPTDLSSGGGIV
jgi:hypothetical protein